MVLFLLLIIVAIALGIVGVAVKGLHYLLFILEQSLAQASPRSLIQMAAGLGKTFTAANACYRLSWYSLRYSIPFFT